MNSRNCPNRSIVIQNTDRWFDGSNYLIQVIMVAIHPKVPEACFGIDREGNPEA